MAPFELSLSESLLLGFCVEEYRQSRSSLFEVFERRLRPFVPLLTQRKCVEVERADVPDDVEWYVLNKIQGSSRLIASVRESDAASEDGGLPEYAASPAEREPTPEYHFQPAQWSPFDHDEFYIGRARSCPKSVFIGNDCREPGRLPGCPKGGPSDGKVLRVFWDTSRRSLVELVIEHVHEACLSSNAELITRRAIAREERWLWDFGGFLDSKWELRHLPNGVVREDGDLPWWPFSRGVDVWVFGLSDRLDKRAISDLRRDVISDAILRIAQGNDFQEVFDAGRQFAKLVLACEEFDGLFSFFRPAACYDFISIHDDLEWEQALDKAFRRVLECLFQALPLPLVKRCPHANSILAHRLWEEFRLGFPSSFLRRDSDAHGPVPQYDEQSSSFEFTNEEIEFASQWSGSSGAAWLAFGDVLATLRETDLATAGKDKPLPSLRMYQLRGDSSVDRVRAALQLAERELANEANAGQHPEVVVTCVAHGIEALARRLWATDFSTGGDARRTLVAILDQKRKFAKSELEQRFATLGLSLYTAYRKPAIHDPDKFRCTWAEAQFFVSGMRVLFDISERLIQDTGGD